MTRSGAENKLTTRFLRDSDEAVERRKVDSTRPFQHRAMVPRLYSHTRFPTRPPWSEAMTPAELEASEVAAFAQWLDDVYALATVDRLSPFEHNLEVWRQLWRVMEKSDVLLLTADVRDPLLHIPLALHEHVTKTLKVPLVIVLTKCDLVSEAHANAWRTFLERAFATPVVLNSGKCMNTHGVGGFAARRKILTGRATHAQIEELHRQARRVLDAAMAAAPRAASALATDSAAPLSVGIMGQPNTGKSSLVNSILGRHAVSVSRTCGHTKHWQVRLNKKKWLPVTRAR